MFVVSNTPNLKKKCPYICISAAIQQYQQINRNKLLNFLLTPSHLYIFSLLKYYTMYLYTHIHIHIYMIQNIVIVRYSGWCELLSIRDKAKSNRHKPKKSFDGHIHNIVKWIQSCEIKISILAIIN